jgi:hypothetical protein
LSVEETEIVSGGLIALLHGFNLGSGASGITAVEHQI